MEVGKKISSFGSFYHGYVSVWQKSLNFAQKYQLHHAPGEVIPIFTDNKDEC